VHRRTDASKNKGKLLVLLWQDDLEPRSGSDVFDDGRLPAGSLEERKERGGLLGCFGDVDDTRKGHLFG
jgi:hypothetical protein